ncbi:hypothetical protein PTKIN_Ptkin06aG0151700 [Pterospermum kingtungense]
MQPTLSTQWIPHVQGTFKVNFDGALKSEDGLGGIEIVVRDWQGFMIRALHTQMKGDAQSIITAINSPYPDLSPIGYLIEEVKLLCKDFQWCLIRHVRRQANMTAHTLAIQALLEKNTIIWLEECPALIRAHVDSDCNIPFMS